VSPARLGNARVAQRGLEAARRLEYAAAAAAAQAASRAAPGPPAGRALLRPRAGRRGRRAARVRAAAPAGNASARSAERDRRVCALWHLGCGRARGGAARGYRVQRRTGSMLAVCAAPLPAILQLAGRARARSSTAQGYTRVRQPSAGRYRRAQLRQRHSDGARLSQRHALAELSICWRHSGARALAKPGRCGSHRSRIYMHAPAARHGPRARAFGRFAAPARAGVEPGRRSRQAGGVHAHAPPAGHGPRACSGDFWDAPRV